MMKIFLVGILLFAGKVQATIVSDRIAATNRLLPLKKVTVGPDDQYHGSVDTKGEILVYTYKTNLVPHLRVQELKSGDVRDFLPLTADSQEPSIGPSGLVAFTYFKFNAKGDICYAGLPNFAKPANNNPEIHCLARTSSEKFEARSNSFWKSNDEIGYVVDAIGENPRRIVTENIHTGNKTILTSGKIYSPNMQAGGHYLTFIKMDKDESVSKSNVNREIVLLDLVNRKEFSLRFALPGISGFPALSADESMLYFSHYPNDSNGDNILDGSDNGVIFRIPVSKIFSNQDKDLIFPEQLTSLESSCSFPHPFKDSVYLTCAFEGSLDIYQMPASGIVPVNWSRQILDNALITSRSYQERILNLNTEKYRFSETKQITNERLLNNHILADETAAARSYLDEIMKTKLGANEKSFYALVKIYLESRELKKMQASSDVTRIFRGQIAQFEHQVASIKSEASFNLILRGLLKLYTEDFHEAANFLAQVRAASQMKPLERYLYFELADQSLSRELPKSEAKLLDAYHIMMTAPELDEEAHIYYAFRLLDKIEQQHKELPERIKVIDTAKKFLVKPVLTLLDSETCVLRLILAGDSEKPKVYSELDRFMSETREDYFLRKALYVRAILNFTTAAQFTYMDLVATAWLKYTTQKDTEFIYAREVVQGSALDQAYANVAVANDNFASSFFYESLSLTDDLESHYGFVQSMNRRNLRSTIDDRYKNLVQRSFIDDNFKFVQALLILIDQNTHAQADRHLTAHLDQAIEKLVAMSQDRDSPARYLLLGSCYLEKLLRTAKGLEFSAELLQKANRTLMLAYDLGRDNVRIQAATLMNLGILQARVQNQGLAVRFFKERKTLGFVSAVEKAAFEWSYARALFLSHQPELAAEELTEVAASEMKPALLERKAFYLMSAQKYDRAVLAYEELFKAKPQIDAISFAKINLSLGFALLKNQQEKEAKNHLVQAVQSLDRLAVLGRGAERSVEFNPNRLKAFAYGFLAQIGNPNERKDALLKRYALLEQSSNLVEDQLNVMIQARLQLAKLTTTELNEKSQYLREAVSLSEKLAKESGYLSHAIYQSSVAALIEGFLHPKMFTDSESKSIVALVQSCMHSYESQKISQAFLNFQNLKLKVLEAAYSAILNHRASSKDEIKALMSAPLAMNVKEGLPKEWENMTKLSAALSY